MGQIKISECTTDNGNREIWIYDVNTIDDIIELIPKIIPKIKKYDMSRYYDVIIESVLPIPEFPPNLFDSDNEEDVHKHVTNLITILKLDPSCQNLLFDTLMEMWDIRSGKNTKSA